MFVQNIHSSLNQGNAVRVENTIDIFSLVQLLSFCNQTLHMSSSLSIIFTPLPYSACCNVTLAPTSSNASEQLTVNVHSTYSLESPVKLFDQQMQPMSWINYSTVNRTSLKSNLLRLPVTISLCQMNLPAFDILIANISKGELKRCSLCIDECSRLLGPCLSNHYRCLTSNQEQWCIDEMFHCDGYHSCPQGADEVACPSEFTFRLLFCSYECIRRRCRLESMSRYVLPKMKRTIRGGVVTTIIVLGLLLIISSVSMAVVFVYLRRKRQRRRQFTYSLESTSDDWEPSGTGYHLFDNWPTNRRNPTDQVIVDANEHMPITSAAQNR